MNLFKKLMAVTLVLVMVFTLNACHGKDETAMTINGIKITSAMYLNALLEADLAARNKVDEEKAAADKASGTSSDAETATAQEETDYFAQTIDGQKYVDYVKENAMDACKEYAFYQKLADDKKISLTDDEKAQATSTAEAYWNYYGYSSYYEPNGISLDTYKKAMIYSYYANAYFLKIYGEGGEKAVDKATIASTLKDKFALVYTLNKAYGEEDTDDTKSAAKSQFNDFVARLKKGEDFKKISDEFNGTTGEANVDVSQMDNEDAAKDSLATIIGDSDTTYASEDFSTVKEMKKGEVKLLDTDTGLTIYVKLDITEDPYYLKMLNDSILSLLKQEEFDKFITGETDKLTVKENKFALNNLSVKKIKYPSADSTGATAQ